MKSEKLEMQYEPRGGRQIVALIRHKSSASLVALFFIAALITAVAPAWASDKDGAMQDCLFRVLQEAGDDATVGQLKTACEAEILEENGAEHQADKTGINGRTALEKRLDHEKRSGRNLWTIMPHRPNYFLLANQNFSSMHEGPWEGIAGESSRTPGDRGKISDQLQVHVVGKPFQERY